MNTNQSNVIPMACNSDAFTAEVHARYQSLVAALQPHVEVVEELPTPLWNLRP